MTEGLLVEATETSYQAAETRSKAVDQVHILDLGTTLIKTGQSLDLDDGLITKETTLSSCDGFSEPALIAHEHNTHLVNSPYLEAEHQLDMMSLDIQDQLLARALTVLAPVTSSFATTTYQASLNWSHVFEKLRDLTTEQNHYFTKQDFYVVEFRSKLKADINRPLLFKLDKESHREATASGGLLKYWFGEPDAERRNLATCKYLTPGPSP